MAKKDKAAKAGPEKASSSAAAPAGPTGPWECECAYENAAEDATCAACDAPRPAAAAAGSTEEEDPYRGYVVGAVLSVEPVAGRDNLKLLSVDIGRGDEVGPLPVVTNAPNVTVGARIVVATIGAQCGEIVVKKANVGGVSSEGIVCDSTMLKWTGGGAGTAALLPAHFEVGSKPPPKRPRLDGN